jgi:hypothetical protein
MVDTTIQQELCTFLGRLPVDQQRRVLEFARSLATPTPQGVRGVTLLRFAGSIHETDLEFMSQVIEDGCERIDTATPITIPPSPVS